jgi:hypothetical protein
MKFDLGIKEKHLNLNVESLKIGDVPIPEKWYKEALAKELTSFEKTKDGKKVLNIVKTLKIANGGITLRYDAKKLMFFLMDEMPELLNKAMANGRK